MVALSLFWVLLLLLRSPLAEAASGFHLRNHTGLLFLYDLKGGYRSENSPASVQDLSRNGYLGNLSTSLVPSTLVRYGESNTPIVMNRAESQLTTEALLPHIGSTFTLEFWLKNPNNGAAQPVRIAGFGNWPSGVAFAYCDPNTTNVGSWQLISHLGPNIVFEMVALVDGVPTCRSVTVAQQSNVLLNVVIRARYGEMQMVAINPSDGLNSQSDSDPPITVASSLWPPAQLTIASPHPGVGWSGTMYMVAMLDRYISAPDIVSNHALGPPNSFPVASAMATTVLEDSSVELYP